jgi:hypothetical protein
MSARESAFSSSRAFPGLAALERGEGRRRRAATGRARRALGAGDRDQKHHESTAQSLVGYDYSR